MLIGVLGFAGGVLWTLNASDSEQTQRLDEFERRADVARSSIVDTMQRLADLEREFELFKQRMEARP
jgi:hypothetical protein